MSTKLIRRALIASGLFIGTAVAFSPTAFAGTSDTVVLAGTVASTLTITATRKTGAGFANLLVLTGASEKIVKVADLAITTNNTTGYTLTASEGNLTDGAHGDTIAFQSATVADNATAPQSTDFTGTLGVFTDATSITTAGENDKDLYIKYTPSATQQAGTYGATITLNVADNS
ncbi:hypothetical protein [Nostoc sp.]|uniref:hypothetical protein n=1 Tax=Nostoc sp. TaxID=1180 RepID=UPI002FF5AD14